MNKLNIIGRITKDVELRKTDSGKSIAKLDIAVRRNIKNANGEYDTDFFNLDAFGTNAEFISKYCNKGDLIGIVARLQNNNYTDKDGNKVYKNAIIVEETTLLGTKKTDNPQQEEQEEYDNYEGFDGNVTVTDDDLPF